MVSLLEQFESSGIDCVNADHYKGTATTIDHLHPKKHRRIGYFTLNYPVEASRSFRRFAAYFQKMAQLRLPTSGGGVINDFPSVEMNLEES